MAEVSEEWGNSDSKGCGADHLGEQSLENSGTSENLLADVGWSFLCMKRNIFLYIFQKINMLVMGWGCRRGGGCPGKPSFPIIEHL